MSAAPPVQAVPAYGTPEWLAWRRGGLGASDLPAILGLDPYRSEHDVWLEKTGQRPGFSGNAKTRWGHRLEAVGLEWWSLNAHPNGNLAVTSTGEPYSQPAYPHLWCTPDGIVRELGMHVAIEVKVTNAWSTPPDRVRVQALVQAGLCDVDSVDVVRLNFEDDPAIFRIERDEAAIEAILETGETWYRLHVIEGMEPPRRADETPADERQTALAADLRSVRKAIEQLERRERAIRDALIASVAGQGLIAGPGWRIEVRAAHDTSRTGWREVAAEYRTLLNLAPADDLDAIEERHRTTSRVRPSVYPKWDEEEAQG